ncbi:MAG: hypothetical protein P1V97_35740 [Planctomycetota bacterium]|nr:hypothetical protein [Planctomycetota bacterium]
MTARAAAAVAAVEVMVKATAAVTAVVVAAVAVAVTATDKAMTADATEVVAAVVEPRSLETVRPLAVPMTTTIFLSKSLPSSVNAYQHERQIRTICLSSF